MSSISSVGSSSTLDTQFAQQLINQSGSSNGSLNENEFIQLLQNNPQLAQGLAGVEGGSSSTTVDQLYQKLSDGNGSISLSQLGTALGQLRSQMQSSGSLPPTPPSDGGEPSLTSVVAQLEQVLKQWQTQGYSEDGTATSTGSVSFFNTTS